MVAAAGAHSETVARANMGQILVTQQTLAAREERHHWRRRSAAVHASQFLAGAHDDVAVAECLDGLAGAQLETRLGQDSEQRAPLANFIKRQLIPVPVDDGNLLKSIRQWS